MAWRGGADVWRLHPVDAPDAPAKGMRLWVQTGDHWSIGDNYAVSRVNTRSFYVSHGGRKQRHDLDRWFHWLTARDDEGFVVLDGHPMRRPRAALAAGLPRLTDDEGEETMRIELRDARLMRAVRNVLQNYEISGARKGSAGLERVHVRRGSRRYVVEVDPDWQRPPRCSCPDAARVEDEVGATFCKHTIAVLLDRPAHRHQLIDLLL